MPSNYRGITLINTMGKIFSLILRNRLNKWCENENVLSDSQYGFREGRSTADAILSYIPLFKRFYIKKIKIMVCIC